ncbi:MAG: MurR/RpiR family transcriptional regulator, partial [Lysinibacillus sp.]
QFSTESSANNLKIARYIINNLEQVIFMTSSEIAVHSNVSQPAVIRFAKLVGYKSFSEFMKDLQEMPHVFSEQTDSNFDDVAQSIVNREYEGIKNLQKYYSEQATKQVAETLFNAKTVHVFGTRTAEILANYFYFYFRKAHSDVTLHTEANMELYERLLTFDKENSILMIFAYPRYSKQVLDLLRLVKKEGIPYIVFADSYALEKAGICDVKLVAPVVYTDVYDSLSATFSLLNILLHRVAEIDPEGFSERKKKNELLYSQTGFFSTE